MLLGLNIFILLGIVTNKKLFYVYKARDQARQQFHNESNVKSVIHRDIKPSNILITFPRRNQKPRCVIADFGLSRQMEIGKSSISGTNIYK